jgi:hypothetical protein
MGVTVIRAIANMNSSFVVNIDKEGTENRSDGISVADSYSGDVVYPFEVLGELDYPIPWCRSPEEFARLHLRLEFFRPSVYPPGISVAAYRMWQEDINGWDRARVSTTGEYIYGAPGLVADRNGGAEYDTRGNSDVVLVVDERPWVVLVRLWRP